MEADNEIDGMRFWDGEPTARLWEFDTQHNALLLERCDPGTPLQALPEPEQDVVLAGLLRRLWRVPVAPHPFRHLSVITENRAAEARAKTDHWIDAAVCGSS